jgi:CDGSH-type Zn-finger protein
VNRLFIQVVLGGLILALIGFSFWQGENEKQVLKLSNTLYQSENRLLKDQLTEVENKSRRERTYEEGLTEGLVRSNNRGYTDGYHAAMNQVSEEKQATAEKDKKKEAVTTFKAGN